MKQALLLAGAAALLSATPAFAKPGHGHGKHGDRYSWNYDRHHHNEYRNYSAYGYGRGGCPPGLAKKAYRCVPPGQAKRMYSVGQLYPQNYGNSWSYNQVPLYLRNQYGFQPNYNYYYGNGYVYQVDPTTMLVQQVVRAILR